MASTPLGFRPSLESLDGRIVPAAIPVKPVPTATLAVASATPPPSFAAGVTTKVFESDPNKIEQFGVGGGGGGDIRGWNKEMQDNLSKVHKDIGYPGKPRKPDRPLPGPKPPPAPQVVRQSFVDPKGTADDVVDVRRAGDAVLVTWNGVTTRTVMKGAESNIVFLDMKGGTNALTVGPLGAKDRVQFVNTTTNYGTNSVRIGEGSLSAVQGTVEVSNNSGTTRAELNDGSETRAAGYGVTTDRVRADGRTVLSYAAPDPSKGWTNGVQAITLTSGKATVGDGSFNLYGVANQTNVDGLNAGVNFTQVNNSNANVIEVRRMAGTLTVAGNQSTDRVVVGTGGSLSAVSGTIAASNNSGRTNVDVNVSGTTAVVTPDGVKVANGPTIRVATATATGGGIDVKGAGIFSIRAEGSGSTRTNAGVATPVTVHAVSTRQTRQDTVWGPAANDPNIVFVPAPVIR